MKFFTTGLSLLILSMTMAFAEIKIDTTSKGEFNSYIQYSLSLSGNDAMALNSILHGDEHNSKTISGIELLTCSSEDTCTIKIGADVITRKYSKDSYECCIGNSRHADYFQTEANSNFLNPNPGISLSSPTTAFYLFADTRKIHARNDKELFRLLKESKSSSVQETVTDTGIKLSLNSENLNLSCIQLNKALKFKHAIVNLGHMGSFGETSFNISHICQLNVKAVE